MRISPELLGQIVEHSLERPDEEVCGVVGVRQQDGEAHAVSVHRAKNVHESALRFEIDPRELLGLYSEIESEGLELGAIYHSHVRSAPYPSQTDVNFAAGWPGVEWIIVGLVDQNAPDVRSYLIDGASVTEQNLEPSVA